ncbi:MAG: fluoride efflux transporter CrcB [Candidatus Nanopelagicales bacterium]
MNGVLLALLVAVAGGLGAIARYYIDTSFPESIREKFPIGILVVNISGSFTLGLVTGSATHLGVWATILGVGFLGGYTTFSTASLDTVTMLMERRVAPALVNSVGMAILCVIAAILGIAITS